MATAQVPKAATTRWTGNTAALLSSATLVAITLLTQGDIAPVVTGLAASTIPLHATWARNHPQHSADAWKIAAVAATYCAAWVAINAWHYLRSVGPCDAHTCALGAPVPLITAAAYLLPLALSTYQASRLLATRNHHRRPAR